VQKVAPHVGVVQAMQEVSPHVGAVQTMQAEGLGWFILPRGLFRFSFIFSYRDFMVFIVIEIVMEKRFSVEMIFGAYIFLLYVIQNHIIPFRLA